ncbi:MAG: ferritin [Bacteroidales bacterium]|nr:ferritin [Bacteroidales bacterium]
MLDKKIEKAYNDQINAEFWSAYLYLSMSAWFQKENMPGFANWMYVQYQEENTHAQKFFRYVNERGGTVVLQPIAKVQTSWKSATDAFKDTLEHERKVTAMINNLVDIAKEVKDHASVSFLNWYVDEQVEEEANAESLLQTLEKIEKKAPGAMYMLDKELQARTFVDATLTPAE